MKTQPRHGANVDRLHLRDIRAFFIAFELQAFQNELLALANLASGQQEPTLAGAPAGFAAFARPTISEPRS